MTVCILLPSCTSTLRLYCSQLCWGNRGRLVELLCAVRRHVNDPFHTRRLATQSNAPFDTQSILQHLYTTHQIEFYIVERPSFTLEQGYSCLWKDIGKKRDWKKFGGAKWRHAPSFPHVQSPTHFCHARISAIQSEGSGGRWRG